MKSDERYDTISFVEKKRSSFSCNEVIRDGGNRFRQTKRVRERERERERVRDAQLTSIA